MIGKSVSRLKRCSKCISLEPVVGADGKSVTLVCSIKKKQVAPLSVCNCFMASEYSCSVSGDAEEIMREVIEELRW